jgi:hypothetical protein
MTWSYSGSPSDSDKDEVRFLVFDTDTNDQQVSDEEIAYAIANEPSNVAAAIRIARALSFKYARRADKAVGDLKINWSQVSKRYSELATELEDSDMVSIVPTPYAGGISISDKDSVEEDSDRVNPSFHRGMHDNPSESEDSRKLCDD